MRFLVPQGIGDITWALTKAQSISRRLGDGHVDISIACSNHNEIQTRSLEYTRRFPFVRTADMLRVKSILQPGPQTDEAGRYRYYPDGPFPGVDYFLIPNAPLERGERLETWHPEDAIDWRITNAWESTEAESDFAANIVRQIGPFVACFGGPEYGNTTEGHNRGGVWSPEDWVAMGTAIRAMGMTPVMIGATYDHSYYRKFVLPAVKVADPWCRLFLSFIGQCSIGQTLALLRRATACVGFQCGLGVWSIMEGVPTSMFWRADGDSEWARSYLSMSEKMASAWVPPDKLDRYLPGVYGRTKPADVATWLEQWRSGWL